MTGRPSRGSFDSVVVGALGLGAFGSGYASQFMAICRWVWNLGCKFMFYVWALVHYLCIVEHVILWLELWFMARFVSGVHVR